MSKKALLFFAISLLLLQHLLFGVSSQGKEAVICKINFDSLSALKAYVPSGAENCHDAGAGVGGTGALVLRGDEGKHIMISFVGVSILPDIEYTVSYDIRMPATAEIAAPNGAGAKVFFRCGTNDDTRTGIGNDGSGEWRRVEETVRSSVAADRIQFCFLNSLSGTEVYIDNFRLVTSDPAYSVDRELYNRDCAIEKEIEHPAFRFDSLEAVLSWSSTTASNYAPGEGIDGSGAMRIVAAGTATQRFRVTGLPLESGLWRLGFSFRVDETVNLVKISSDTGAKLYISGADDSYNRVGMPSNHDGEWQTVSMAVPVISGGTIQLTLRDVPAGTVILIDEIRVGAVDLQKESVEEHFAPVEPIEADPIVLFGTEENAVSSDSASETGQPLTGNSGEAEPSAREGRAAILLIPAAVLLTATAVILCGKRKGGKKA